MNTRIPCCIPFCRRTASGDRFPGCTTIICGKHWRLASPVLRRRRARLNRRIKRLPEDTRDWLRAVDLEWKLWKRIETQIVERAAGISA